MNETLVELTEDGELEFNIDLPEKEEFVACAQCGHRSYMHFWFMDGLLSYCKNHGERNEEKLTAVGGNLVFDNRVSLEENRTQGQL